MAPRPAYGRLGSDGLPERHARLEAVLRLLHPRVAVQGDSDVLRASVRRIRGLGVSALAGFLPRHLGGEELALELQQVIGEVEVGHGRMLAAITDIAI
jgi:hypothetical protein